jgi:hypothetical protein
MSDAVRRSRLCITNGRINAAAARPDYCGQRYVTGSRVAGRRTARDCAGVPRPGRELTDHAVSASSLGFRPGSHATAGKSCLCPTHQPSVGLALPRGQVQILSPRPISVSTGQMAHVSIRRTLLSDSLQATQGVYLWWVVLVDRAQGIISHPPNGWLRSRRRPEGDERPSADEISHGSVRAEIVQPKTLREEAQPPRRPASEVDRHRKSLGGREEALLRGERLPPNLNLQRRTDANVADPVGVLPQTEQITASWVSGS